MIDAVRTGIAASGSLMTPCAAAPHALRLLRQHPEVPFGVQLTPVCEAPHLRWGPLSACDQVPSLLTDDGGFFAPTPAGRAELPARARLDHVEREFRARIDAAAAGPSPTHLDFHCLTGGGRETSSTSAGSRPSPSAPSTAWRYGSGSRPRRADCASKDFPSWTTPSSTASPSR
ncbi:ChbG/HpnK family deacetylase [Kitasatospora sp. NPDC059577]|uniref:ChbG/HpnK family deacetylase n=1 Tax=Kitasatospora sp. NPDC059577 TaxID=3346873 RepID=UPI0036A802BA